MTQTIENKHILGIKSSNLCIEKSQAQEAQVEVCNKNILGIIHLGDCLPIMRRFPSRMFRVIVTSPPYNINLSRADRRYLATRYDNYDDNMPQAEYIAWQRNCIAEMLRLLRPDGAIFYNHKWMSKNGLLDDRRNITDGFPVRQIIIWSKRGNPIWNNSFFSPNFEVIYIIANQDFRLAQGVSVYGCVWKFPYPPVYEIEHPAMFPTALPARCIEAVGGGPVLDPFMGSGTSAIAAERFGVEWCGIEQSEKYVKLARSRVATEQKKNKKAKKEERTENKEL